MKLELIFYFFKNWREIQIWMQAGKLFAQMTKNFGIMFYSVDKDKTGISH